MKKINLLIVSIFILLFIGCQNFEPELSHIYIIEHKHCTYTIEKTEVPLYSFFKITVIPEPGYYIDRFYEKYYETAKFYKSTDEENTYFILARSKELDIDIYTSECTKYNISPDEKITNCKISSSRNRTFEGDTVTFTITPTECFYIDPATIEVRKKLNNYSDYEYEKIDFTQSQTNPNEFSFVMPNKNVAIYAEAKFAIEISPRKNNYKQGETIIFDITNHKPEDTFNIKIADGYSTTKNYDYKLIQSGITLSDIYELPYSIITQKYSETETGRYTLHIYPKNSDYNTKIEATADFVIDLPDIPEGWTTIGIKSQGNYLYKYEGFLDYSVYFYLSNIQENYNYLPLNFKYSFENDNPLETIEGDQKFSFSNYSKYCDINLGFTRKTIDLTPFTRIVVWLEDEDYKYISRKITLRLDDY